MRFGLILIALVTTVILSPLCAQGNYEVQVYGSETIPRGMTMLEFHTNYTASGSRDVVNGVIPTQHAWHETFEITHGWNEWFETGFYVFTSYNPGYGYQWVGDHIRPRIRAPEEWHWPVGVSLSAEFGYQRSAFSEDTWSIELRPIVDKTLGKWYLVFNPAVDRSFHGPGVNQGVSFSPNGKFAYSITKKIQAGLEYYGALGPITGFDPFRDQQQQILPALDVDFGPNWEFNFGVGVGVTHSTDHLLIKMILGRRFSFGRRPANGSPIP